MSDAPCRSHGRGALNPPMTSEEMERVLTPNDNPRPAEPTGNDMDCARVRLAKAIADADRVAEESGLQPGAVHPATLSFGILSGLVGCLAAAVDARAGLLDTGSLSERVRGLVAAVRAFDEWVASSQMTREAGGSAPVIALPGTAPEPAVAA